MQLIKRQEQGGAILRIKIPFVTSQPYINSFKAWFICMSLALSMILFATHFLTMDMPEWDQKQIADIRGACKHAATGDLNCP